ncbi:MAG: tetratricopeptide repeat protein [Okeania sp. SIO2H7]|nr:tetratricopeptide repeat protein [Okeania sp. SIO2H7]
MKEKSRGFLLLAIVLSILAFVGFSLSPLLGGILEETQIQGQGNGAPTQTVGADRISDLQSQARGYELVLQREPDNQTALRGLLEVRLELVRLEEGEIEDAIAPLEKLSELNPENREYSILLAQAKEYTGDREGAAQVYRSILTQQPGDIVALQGLTDLLVRQERPEAAIGLLQDTLKAAPQVNQLQPGSIDVTSVQLILGSVFAKQQRYEEAIAVYEEAMKASADDFRPIYAKAVILQEQGKAEEAQGLFAKALELAPPNVKDRIKQQAGFSSTPEVPAPPEPSPSLEVE